MENNHSNTIVDIANTSIKYANDRHDNTLRIVAEASKMKAGFHKDIATACLAALAGALTLLTVKPDLIGNQSVFLLGIGIVALAYVATFIARSYLNNYMIDITTKLFVEKMDIVNKAQAVINNTDDDEALEALSEELKAGSTFHAPKYDVFYHHLDTYIGHYALLGGILFVFGIFVGPITIS